LASVSGVNRGERELSLVQTSRVRVGVVPSYAGSLLSFKNNAILIKMNAESSLIDLQDMQESIDDIVDQLSKIYRIRSPFDQTIGFRESIAFS
jgi:hypothetical protein